MGVALRTKNNKYDYLIMLMISLLVLGDIGGAFQPVRILSLLFLPQVFFAKYPRNSMMKSCALFFALWYLYMVISLMWTPDISQAYKELLYYVAHFSSFLLLLIWARLANKPLNSIVMGWGLFVLISIPFALNEIIFDHHYLNMESFEASLGGGVVYQKKYAALFNANYNTYVTHLCYALPFLCAYILMKRKLNAQCFGWGILAAVVFIMLMNSSRGGLLVSGITLLIFFYYYRNVKFKGKRLIVFCVAILILVALVYYFDVIFEQVFYRFVVGGERSGSGIAEDTSRTALIWYTLSLFKDTYYVGTGIGSMVASLETISQIGITACHNLFLEIVLQYGIIIFFFCCIFWTRIVVVIKKKSGVSKFILLSALICFPISSVINAIYLLMPPLWLFMSSLLCIAEMNYENKQTF